MVAIDDYGVMLDEACKAYGASREPAETEAIYRLELERAFAAGAEWHTEVAIKRLEAESDE